MPPTPLFRSTAKGMNSGFEDVRVLADMLDAREGASDQKNWRWPS